MYAYPGEAFIAWEALVTSPGSGAATSGLGEGGQKAQRPEEAASRGEGVERAPCASVLRSSNKGGVNQAGSVPATSKCRTSRIPQTSL